MTRQHLRAAAPTTAPPPWHALPVEEATQRLGTGSAGLDEETVAQRLARYGPNQLEPEKPKSSLEMLLNQFKSPLIYILLVAAVVTIAIAEYVDTGVIVAVLVLNATVGFIQERKADRSVRALMQLAAPKSIVVRGGHRREVDSTELVPGGLVLLESGTRLPADLRVVSATALRGRRVAAHGGVHAGDQAHRPGRGGRTGVRADIDGAHGHRRRKRPGPRASSPPRGSPPSWARSPSRSAERSSPRAR